MRSIFFLADSPFIEVTNLDSARLWYEEKLGCISRPKRTNELGDDVEAAVVCRFEKDEDEAHSWIELAKMRNGQSQPSSVVPIIYCLKISKAYESVSSRGVGAGPIQDDGGGSKFFEVHDCEGNLLEICEN